jgi:ATP-dependent Clp protease adaptor protein ClpS
MESEIPVNDTLPYIEIDRQKAYKTSEGPLYQVIIHNDDVTPMDFVIHILVSVFELNTAHALQVMYTAHYQGSAYVQTLPRPEAHRRVGLAHLSARLNGYPLGFTLKPEATK